MPNQDMEIITNVSAWKELLPEENKKASRQGVETVTEKKSVYPQDPYVFSENYCYYFYCKQRKNRWLLHEIVVVEDSNSYFRINTRIDLAAKEPSHLGHGESRYILVMIFRPSRTYRSSQPGFMMRSCRMPRCVSCGPRKQFAKRFRSPGWENLRNSGCAK